MAARRRAPAASADPKPQLAAASPVHQPARPQLHPSNAALSARAAPHLNAVLVEGEVAKRGAHLLKHPAHFVLLIRRAIERDVTAATRPQQLTAERARV